MRVFNSSGLALGAVDGELFLARDLDAAPDTFLVAVTFVDLVAFVALVAFGVAGPVAFAAAGTRDAGSDAFGFLFAILTTIKHDYRRSDEVAASVTSDVPTGDQE